MSLGGSILNWPTEIWRSTDDVLGITQQETSELISEGIHDLGRGFRSLTIDLLGRER